VTVVIDLGCCEGQIVHTIIDERKEPKYHHLYDLLSKTKRARIMKDATIGQNIKRLFKSKQFCFKDDRARRMLAVAMSHVPSLSNMAAATFIPCILSSFLMEIKCRKIMMDQELKLFVSSDHGHKKGLHHLIKVLSFWDKKWDEVRRFVVDTDASGGTSADTADGIKNSLKKFDLPGRQIILAGQHGDAGGGGTKESLCRELKKRNLSAPTIKCFGNGGLESRNVLQLLFTCWNLIQQFEWDEFKTLWTSCTGTPMQKRMDQPVLTRWEYVGKAIAWLAWKRKCYSCTSIIPKSLS